MGKSCFINRDMISGSVHVALKKLKKRKNITDFQVLPPENKMQQHVDVKIFITNDKTVKFKAGPECSSFDGARHSLAAALSGVRV